jgi:cytoskeletal protein CcmA (bactofilin family)
MIWKSDAKPSELNGFLDSGSHVHGELRFDASFRVDGKFTGTVASNGDLIVGEGGEVEGELAVGQIFVSGTVRGSIRASKRIQISPSGKVYAEIDTPSLVIEDGAFFEGRCSMSREGGRVTGPQRVVAKVPSAG